MTLDEAVHAAGHLLAERGQLLNGHLLRLVDGDKELFREVRERLIAEGIAEDRSGVGLARAEQTPSDSVGVPESETLQSTTAEWWLMSSGASRGPYTLATLCTMRRTDEMNPGDVVRCGDQGPWKHPDEIPELFAAKPKAESIAPFGMRKRPSKERYDDRDSTQATQLESPTGEAMPYVLPDKMWSLGNQRRPGWLTRSWKFSADIVGGDRRLKTILTIIISLGLFAYWWNQPPPARTIYNEFTACRGAILKLQDRRAKRSEWAPVVERYRPRIQAIVDRLQSHASDRYPIRRELYSAGSFGLLPLLENPMDPTMAERLYDQHMAAAHELLDGTSAGKSQPTKAR